jgi:hypothetical protein
MDVGVPATTLPTIYVTGLLLVMQTVRLSSRRSMTAIIEEKDDWFVLRGTNW